MSVALRWHEAGTPAGPPLVLGASLGTTSELWDGVLATLGERHRVLSYEHRGHGGSPAPPGDYTVAELAEDVLAGLAGRGVDTFSYAGVSLGGMVGMQLATTVPDRVRRLALLCTTAHFADPAPWSQRAHRARTEGLARLAGEVPRRWFTPTWAQANPAQFAHWEHALAGCDPQGYAGCCAAVGALDLRPALPSVTAATLVVAGAQDLATPPEQAERIAAAIPAAVLEVVESAAHLAVVEQAEALATLLAAHLH